MRSIAHVAMLSASVRRFWPPFAPSQYCSSAATSQLMVKCFLKLTAIFQVVAVIQHREDGPDGSALVLLSTVQVVEIDHELLLSDVAISDLAVILERAPGLVVHCLGFVWAKVVKDVLNQLQLCPNVVCIGCVIFPATIQNGANEVWTAHSVADWSRAFLLTDMSQSLKICSARFLVCGTKWHWHKSVFQRRPLVRKALFHACLPCLSGYHCTCTLTSLW